MSELTPKGIIDLAKSYFTEPVCDGLLKSYINMKRGDYRNRSRMISAEQRVERMISDESVGEFFTKLFRDDRLVKNVVSAIYHGIYGGDIYKLSMKQTFLDSMWRAAAWPTAKGHSWVETKDMALIYDMEGSPNYPRIHDMAQRALNWSTMMFPDGLLTLANSLVNDLKRQRNVKIKTGSRVTSLSHKDNKVLVGTVPRSVQKRVHAC